MALIEADTDGVYFAVPPAWMEERERHLVAEIGAALPAGIRLEYEGRYRSMLSHEVKNYGLLTYDGQLIVRGVALRSSRAEPFGERFLRRALLCTMTGDVVGVRDAYQETVDALRQRQLTAADVAARVRLSKTPEAYQTARSEHSEQAYEALLAAGRTTWAPGERVRFYRSPSRLSVWVPDESEEIISGDAQEAEAKEDGRTPDQTFPSLHPDDVKGRRDYDVEHYLKVLVTSYASRLRKAYTTEDFEQLFRIDEQLGLFDRPVEEIQPLWIRCQAEDNEL